MNPFTALMDWLDLYADYCAPIGALVGIVFSVGLCAVLA